MTRFSMVGLICLVMLAAGSSAFAQWSGGTTDSSVAVTTNCLDRLGTNTYSCEVKASSGGTFSAALAFSAGTLIPEGFGGTLTCACAIDGSYAAPKFNHSKTKWQCVGIAGGGVGYSFEGLVSASRKIARVTAAGGDGGTYTISCSGP